MPKKNIRMALIYDFDGTLAPGYMQDHSFLKQIEDKLKIKPKAFWREVKAKSKSEQADEVLVYMSLMLEKAHTAKLAATKKAFKEHGKGIILFLGVRDWFKHIDSYAKSQHISIEHYLISSGNREIFLGTAIASKFDNNKIFASKYLFDQHDVATWPALAVNYTAKTQFLFRINKDVLDISDDDSVNEFTSEDERPIPFENMIFIGDGATDIPCFKLVKNKGGMSIAVYKPHANGAKQKAEQYLKEGGRVDLVVPANYSKDKEIYKAVTRRIDLIAAKYAFQNAIKRPPSPQPKNTK